MDRKLGGLIVLCAFLGACGGLTDTQKEIHGFLKDPESARFKLVSSGKHGIECGTVNAKNSMGGYTGDRAYMTFQGMLAAAETDEESIRILSCCQFISEMPGNAVPWSDSKFGQHCVGLPSAGWTSQNPCNFAANDRPI